MSIASVTTFVTAIAVVVALALVLAVASIGYAATAFFVENRRVRVARREPLVRYYRTLAFSH